MSEKSVKIAVMEEKDLAEKLMLEGYAHLYVWEDGPDVDYPEHTHRVESAHIILSGEMSMTMNGETKTFRTGERCDLPAGIVHSVRTGPQGCRYLIAER
ncbi:MAG TPA: cupin domain-containing protein [Candidatus Acidoferrum sp.]|nr:cupin domain-containing protein [Candidatus Acidoferrum sp.]